MTDAERFRAILRAVSDPGSITDRSLMPNPNALWESREHWQARAVDEVIGPWLAEARADERRACAAELRAAAESLDGCGAVDLVRAATFDCADMIAPKENADGT